MEKRKVKLIFSNAREFEGYSCSKKSEQVFETIFCNDMIGYEEMIFDPRFFEKLVVMSYPLIGNCGVSQWTMKKRAFLGGLAARELSGDESQESGVKKIYDALDSFNVPAIDGLDTREIVRMLRTQGRMLSTIAEASDCFEDVKYRFSDFCMQKSPIIKCVSGGIAQYSTADASLRIAAIDCSVGHDIAKDIWNMGASVTVFSPDTKVQEIENGGFDALIITDGPGNGDELTKEVSKIKEIPIFAIGVGALVVLKSAFKDAVLHKRVSFCVNRPIRDIKSSQIFIASKYCDYDVDEKSVLSTGFNVTMRDIVDLSVAGFESSDERVSAILAVPQKEKLSCVLKEFLSKVNGEKIYA